MKSGIGLQSSSEVRSRCRVLIVCSVCGYGSNVAPERNNVPIFRRIFIHHFGVHSHTVAEAGMELHARHMHYDDVNPLLLAGEDNPLFVAIERDWSC